MKAARIQRFGPSNLITIDDLPRPEAGAGELLVRVKAAGVGHWDALIREGKVKDEPFPLILGSELSESSKPSELERLDSRPATKSTGQRTSISRVDTQNMHWLALDGWP